MMTNTVHAKLGLPQLSVIGWLMHFGIGTIAWGGAFFVFEKTRGPDGRFQDMNTHVYNEYKINKGYSPSEIFSKSRALTGVLEPFSDKGNIDMFKRAGFKDIQYIFTNICFKGWICIK